MNQKEHFLTRFSKRLSAKAVCLLYLGFLGWNEVRRWFSRYRSWFLSPSRMTFFAVVGFIGIFIYWIWHDTASPGESLSKRLHRFTDDYSLLLYVYALAVPIVTWLIGELDKLHSRSEEEKIRRSQKERIKLLDGFAPSPETVSLFSNRSIYDAIIGTLSRLEDKKGKSEEHGKQRFHVCLLLCSPALDYPGRETAWGEEFKNKFRQVVNHHNIYFDICHLPIKPMLGFKPMEDFLSVLADFIKDDDADFIVKHKMLVERTETIAAEFTKWANEDEHKKRFKIHDPMLDIPFQIVLVLGDNLKEVVVSFAGREMLERGGTDGAEPKGFFSSDPYVVETFHQIYLDYVQRCPRSLVPAHTQKIIEAHKKNPEHQIKNYLGVIPNLHVGNGCFSPALANSTKFTGWTINTILTSDDSPVLDIGSGTGVLALLAQNAIKGASSPRIVAVESNEDSYQSLKMNCPPSAGVEIKKWRLSEKMENGDQIGGCFIDLDKGGEEVPNATVGKFKTIIADLPFVDVREDLGNDQRFFDPKHKAHRTLFMAVNKNEWLADGGRLITAFSSLGGPDDISRFECLIADNDLQIVQRVDFHESSYLWIVHVIVKKTDFEKHNDQYWWKKLLAGQDQILPIENATTKAQL